MKPYDDYEKKICIDYMMRCPMDEWIFFNGEKEKEYIIYLCETQTNKNGLQLLTNGVSTDRASQTKWKKQRMPNR